MKNAFSVEKLSSTDGKTDFASRVKNLLANSPLVKRKRSMSLSTLTHMSQSPSLVFGNSLDTLVARDGGNVPFIIKKIVDYIEQDGLDTEGIYRVNGNAKIIEKLKLSFDKVGDANFEGEDIAAIAGLLKLFLRELPEGIIPNDMVSHFVQVQQAHPREPTPRALSLLQQCIQSLPPTHFTSLKYLIKHLSLVAQHSSENKMTPVSLSIVFGPNIFHCGEGIAALQLQGYSNATVCRMIQHHEMLFGGQEVVVLRKRSLPAKPRPYSEHITEKRLKQDPLLSPIRSSSIVDSTSDLERTYSEKSIDEAIMERSLSPTSPAHLRDQSSPKSPPPRPPPPVFKSPLLIEPQLISTPNEGTVQDDDDDSPFHRRYAKRGLKFTPRSPEKVQSSNIDGDESQVVKSLSVEKAETKSPVKGQSLPAHSSGYKRANGDVLRHSQLSVLSLREDEAMLRTPSPHSWAGSPVTTPPTSPAITPRSSRVITSVIDQSIQQYLFQPPPVTQSQPKLTKSNSTPLIGSAAPKADVYGLLLPDKPTHKPTPPVTTNNHTTTTEDDTPSNLVVKRRSDHDGKKLRNRKSALFGKSTTHDPQSTTPPDHTDSIQDMEVQIVSVSPEQSTGSVETRQGKLSELVTQFEHIDGGCEVVGEEGTSKKKRKPSNKAFEMFEQKGIVIGMGAPPQQPDKPRVSFASTATTLSQSPSPSPVHTAESSPAHLQAAGGSILSSDDLTTVSKYQLSTSTWGDEDVFSSPGHHNPPLPPPTTHRDVLSTTASDDVFASPLHHENGRGQDDIDGGQRSPSDDFNDIKREKLLDHVTLSRPKGPPARRQPQRGKTTPSLSLDNEKKSCKVSTPPPTESIDQSDVSNEPTDGKSSYSKGQSGRRSKSISPERTDLSSAVRDHDLSSLAPESLRDVEEGWCEGVSGVGSAESTGTLGVKELIHKIHALKKQVKEFEVSFLFSHGHKPTGDERGPVKHIIEHVLALRKQLKALQASSPPPETTDLTDNRPQNKRRVTVSGGEIPTPSTGERSLVETHTKNEKIASKEEKIIVKPTSKEEKSVHVAMQQPVSKEGKTLTKTELSLEKSKSLRDDMSSKRSKSLGDVVKNRVVPSSLLGTLNKLMSSLETRRKASGRPDDLNDMTADQLQQEKRDTQKVLLQFEKAHGRPTSREDKETMRPLYDRYRLVKRLSASGEARKKDVLTSHSLTSPRHSLDALESTNDSLPSVTMLHSTTLGLSLPTVPEHKSVRSTSSSNHSLSKSTHEISKKGSTNELKEREVPNPSEDKQETGKERLMSDSQLKLATLDELTHQNRLLLEDKKEIRTTLKKFETKFQLQHGRSVQKEDRRPMQEEYDKYKNVKTRLKIVSSLLAKINPQRTV